MAALAHRIGIEHNRDRPTLRAEALVVEKSARIDELGLLGALNGELIELIEDAIKASK